MSKWYDDDEDPFSKVGLVRVIVVKHNRQYGFSSYKDNCIDIIATHTFQYNFASPPINSRNEIPRVTWMDDEVTESCEHKINHLFKEKTNGIYELIGELWHWSSRSYEGEWDGDSEIRNAKIQEIGFKSAVCLEDSRRALRDEMIWLIPMGKPGYSADWRYSDELCIHKYMPKNKILRNQAYALTRIINENGYYHSTTSYENMKDEELENVIHMLMLEIDSKNIKEKCDAALKIDKEVRDCLKDHNNLMNKEYE